MKKSERTAVYEKYAGRCVYCGKIISVEEMQVDHITPLQSGGLDAIKNYNPSCRRCNRYKRARDMEQFRQYMKTLHERMERDYITKVGIDFGIVKIIPFDGRFYFEKPEETNERLTEWTGERWIARQQKLNGKTVGDKDIYAKLAEYEDIGLKPEKVNHYKTIEDCCNYDNGLSSQISVITRSVDEIADAMVGLRTGNEFNGEFYKIYKASGKCMYDFVTQWLQQ